MRLAYDIYPPPGDQEKNLPPVILLHGMLDSGKTWKQMGPRIAQRTGRNVYALDARNHGESPWSDEFDFDILADDLEEFLEQHGIRKASLVGHSMGGRTAAILALRKPERVERLVVEDMNLRDLRPSSNSPIMVFVNLLKSSLEAIPPDADDRAARKAIAQFFKSLLEQQGSNSLGMSPGYDLSMMPLRKDKNGYSWLTNFKAVETLLTTNKITHTIAGTYMGDSLFLYGPKSFFKVHTDTSIEKHFPRAVKVGVENSNHLVHFEYPERFLQEVCDFINGGYKCKSKY